MNNQKHKRKDKIYLNYLLQVFIFRIILDVSYFYLSIGEYRQEFSLNFNFFKCVISYICLICLCLVLESKKRVTTFPFEIIIFFTITPFSSVFCMANQSFLFFFLVCFTFFLVVLFSTKIDFSTSKTNEQLQAIPQGRIIALGKPNIISSIASFFCVAISISAAVWMLILNGIPKLSSLNLNNVYYLRNSFQSTKYLSYLVSLITTVVVPFGLAEGYVSNNRPKICFYFVIQLWFFLWTGHKTWLFSIFLIGFVMLILKKNESKHLLFLSVILLGLIACIIEGAGIVPNNLFFSLVNRRVLLEPGVLKFAYYDYFIIKDNPIVGFSGTILAPIFNAIRPRNVSILNYTQEISKIYTGTVSNAGTGLYGGDIANWGVFSFFLAPFFLLIFVELINKTNKHCGEDFSLILFAYLSYSFNDQRIVAFFLDITGVFLFFLINIYQYKRRFLKCK